MFSNQVSKLVNGFKFRKLFHEYLFVTNVVTTSLLTAAGGMVSQQIEVYLKRRDRLDLKNIRNLAAIGVLLGSEQHFLYGFIDHRWPGNSIPHVFKKIIFDHLIISNVSLCVFFVGLSALEGVSNRHLLDDLMKKYTVVYPVDAGIGIPTQIYNFYFLNPKFRVIYSTFVTTVTSTVFSLIKRMDFRETTKEEAANSDK